MTSSPQNIEIFEVSPRDGLQNEPTVIDTAAKLQLIERIVNAGVTDIEVTSFVRPSWIPQLADANDLVAMLPQIDGVRYWALVPNRRGLDRALDAGIAHIGVFMSASETHNKKNLNRTRRESITALQGVIGQARDEDLSVRAYISTVFGCPYEVDVPVDNTIELAQSLAAAGAQKIVLGDTTGMANPLQVHTVVETVVASGIPLDMLALHLHDTRGTALANAVAGWRAGIRTFDGSIAGVGGCPYAPGAAGNAATEDLVHLFEAMGVQTGLDLDQLADAGIFLSDVLGRSLPGRYHRYHLGSQPVSKTRTA